MHTYIENIETEDGIIINWRKRHNKVQLKCPRCDNFFDVPRDVKFDDYGNANDYIYHFCDDDLNEEGWVVLPTLVGWSRI